MSLPTKCTLTPVGQTLYCLLVSQSTTTRAQLPVALTLVQASSLICVDKALSGPQGGSGLPSPLFRQNCFPPALSCPVPSPASSDHVMLEGEEPSNFTTAPASCRLQSMSIAFGLLAPWVKCTPLWAQWLALLAQLPSTSGHGVLWLALQVVGSIVRHCLPHWNCTSVAAGGSGPGGGDGGEGVGGRGHEPGGFATLLQPQPFRACSHATVGPHCERSWPLAQNFDDQEICELIGGQGTDQARHLVRRETHTVRRRAAKKKRNVEA